MKNFVKAMDSEGSGSAFLQRFPRIGIEKLKAGIFDGPQIREFVKDPMFDEALSEAKLSAWQSLKSVVLKKSWETTRVRNTRMKLKSYRRVSANSKHECQLNCIPYGHIWSIF